MVRAVAPFLVVLVTVLFASIAADAHHTDLRDPDDTRGALDVREVRLAHEGGPPAWSIVTFAKWGVLGMWDRGYLIVFLDTQGSPEAEYYLLIRSDRWSLEGTLWRAHVYGPDSLLGTVPVWRQSGRSASVRVRLTRLTFGPNRIFYRWWAETVYTSDGCRRSCHDRAPNGTATVLQWRPGMSPTPSPSPSPTSTPTPTSAPSP
jgi:hypothetical protein